MEEYLNQLGIPSNHKLVQTDTQWKQKKGLDTDTYWYDELDENGNVVAKYVITDSTSMYPPFSRTIEHEKNNDI